MGSSPGPTGIRLLRAPEESPRLEWVGKGGVEPPRPFGHTDLNRARLPFRHLPWRATTLSADRGPLTGGRSAPAGPAVEGVARRPRGRAARGVAGFLAGSGRAARLRSRVAQRDVQPNAEERLWVCCSASSGAS